MSWEQLELDLLVTEIWTGLVGACSQMTHPFRTPSLATNHGEGGAARTVVLRQVSRTERRLTCYTDYRNPKVIQIARCTSVEWLFYDPQNRVQVRARGTAQVQRANPAERSAWEQLPLSSRMLYCAALPPGTPVATPEEAWPQFVLERNPTVESVEPGWDNFSVVHTTLSQIDFLLLDWDLQRRALFDWDGKQWMGQWVVP